MQVWTGVNGLPVLPPPHPPPHPRAVERQAQRDLKGTFLAPKPREMRTVKERSESSATGAWGFIFTLLSLS